MNGLIRRLTPPSIRDRYEVHHWRNALPILTTAFPDEWFELVQMLDAFELRRSEIAAPGRNKSRIAERIDSGLYARGWREAKFETRIMVDQQRFDAPTHAVDCYKNRIALEVEWNNKDPFFDRDLNNFRLLFDLRAVEVGIIITRCDDLQHVFNRLGKGDSYGASTTHMSKLLPRIEGGGGGGCPILVLGIGMGCYVED